MAACHVVKMPPVLEQPRCFVHEETAPCPHDADDAPAFPFPYHVFGGPAQAANVAAARHLTRGTRPIRVHEDLNGGEGHILRPGADCWCDTVDIPAG
jgi:hypothetical protein